MVNSIIRALVLLGIIFVVSNLAEGQIWREIVPLKSKRADVNKIQNATRLPDGASYFDLKEEAVTIRYYKNQCSAPDEKKFNLSTDVVIEIKRIPKTELPLTVFEDFYQGRYETIPLSESSNIYIDFVSDLIAVSETPSDKPELVKEIFYLPKISKLPGCLVKVLDRRVQQAFEASKEFQRFGQSVDSLQLETYLDRSKDNWNKVILEYFSTILKKSEGVKGYVIIYTDKKAKQNEALFWIKKLEKFLVIEKKIDRKRISFLNGGNRSTTMAELYVRKKTDKAPKPKPQPDPK